MNSSVPSESSTIDTAFVVGIDLVEFERHDLPIYATPASRWADAGLDTTTHGAPLDRLFGEPGEIHLSGTLGGGQDAATATMLSDDPLVVLTGLSDGLIVPAGQPSAWAGSLADAHVLSPPSCASEIVTIFDIGIGSSAAVHLHDGGSWDISSNEWNLDYSA